jgi:hypothetical protein
VIEFEKETSLISLNLEFAFNCTSSSRLLERLADLMKTMTPAERRLSLEQIENKVSPSQLSESNPVDSFNLGLLSIYGDSATDQTLTQTMSHDNHSSKG